MDIETRLARVESLERIGFLKAHYPELSSNKLACYLSLSGFFTNSALKT